MRILPFGGCFLHNPLNGVLRSQDQIGIFSEMGLKSGPFSLSANTNNQLFDFLHGRVSFPTWVKNIAYSELLEPPTAENAKLIKKSDLALIGMSTPTELVFDGALLNVNRFDEVVDAEFSKTVEKKLLNSWRKALMQVNHLARKETSERLYSLLPKETEQQENMANLTLNTYSRTLSVDEMTKSTADLRDRLEVPMAMILYNFMFMPDGRPVQWPAGFKDDCIEVARRLDLPTFDFAPFVAREGVDKVMMDDRRHWNPPYYHKLGEVLYDFCAGLADRPPRRAPAAPKPEVVAAPKAASLAARAASEATIELAKPIEGPAPEAVTAPRGYDFDHRTGSYLPDPGSTVFAVVVLGGAWANGANADPADAAVTDVPEHPRRALMFDAGLRPRGRDVQRFVDLRERGGGGAKETPCAGLADHIIRNTLARFGSAPTLLFFSVSKGGTSLSGAGQGAEDGLLRGSAQHREVLRLLGRARDIATGQKRRLEVAAICLLHGEMEAGRAGSASAYRRGLSNLQLQYDADVRGLTGQSEPVRLYLTQTNRGSVRFRAQDLAMAQLNARFDNPYVQCVGPTYFAPAEARPERAAIYLKAVGYRRVGQLFGRFLLDDLWGAQREPLRVEEAYRVGPKTIRLRYNRPVGLEEDDSRVNISDLGPGLGVDFHDGTPWSPTVEGLRQVRDQDCELDVELSAPSQGYRKCLLIAGRTTGGGGVGNREGARSGIRSKEPFDIDPLDGAELFDWACSEQVGLP